MPDDTTPSTSAPAPGTASATKGLDPKPAPAVDAELARLKAAVATTVLLEPRWPTTTFDHGVKGADPITAGGTLVPASLVADIEAAAKAAGVRVVQILRTDVEQPVARLFRRIASDVKSL